MNLIKCRREFWSAGGNSVWPVVLCRMQRACSSTLAIFRKTKQYKQRRQEYSTGFPGRTDSSMHHLRAPRQRLWPPSSFFCVFFYLIRKFCNNFICSLFWDCNINSNPLSEGKHVISVGECVYVFQSPFLSSLLFTSL